ncbi:MAG TPA: Ohr family peroxiredoxin [Aggregatilineales bacterium]|nr:Ohr family peroxiredoxin [Aggregatilineales bacterium]
MGAGGAGTKRINLLYTAEATVSGGRRGYGRTSDGRLDVQFSSPLEMGGPGGTGTNPEQLFALGYAACFQSTLIEAARRESLNADDSRVTARVGIGQAGNDRMGLAVEIVVHMPSVTDPRKAQLLVNQADQRCPYSNAIRGNVDVKLIIL